MKANELMIGDWIYAPHNGNATHYGRITAILPSGAVEVDLNGDTVLCSSGSVEPITITPEILEKNGFTRLNKSVRYFLESTDYYDVAIREITDSIWCFEYQNCEAHFPPCLILSGHLHELQHCLKLVGIEKEITI